MTTDALPHRLRTMYERWGLGAKGPEILLEAACEIDRLRLALKRIVNDSDIQCRNPNYDHKDCPLDLARKVLKPEFTSSKEG